MSLRQPHLVILKSVIQRVRQNAGDRTLKCLILGYPDILLPRAGIESVFGNLPDSAFRPHPAPDKLPAWAAEAGGDRSLVDTDGLLQALGLSVDYVDLYRHRGPERLVDLNEPLAEDFTGAYDYGLRHRNHRACLQYRYGVHESGRRGAGGWVYRSFQPALPLQSPPAIRGRHTAFHVLSCFRRVGRGGSGFPSP